METLAHPPCMLILCTSVTTGEIFIFFIIEVKFANTSQLMLEPFERDKDQDDGNINYVLTCPLTSSAAATSHQEVLLEILHFES